MKSQIIKAKRCYICSDLIDYEYDGGFDMIKWSYVDVNKKCKRKKVYVCRECAFMFMNIVKSERIKNVQAQVDESR